MTPSGVAVVSGPVNGGKGQIFGSPIEDLSKRGFTMEEFFLEGTAVSYAATKGSDLGLDGLWDVEPADEAAYKTRAYVVRPADSAKFNGIVLVNWQNVTIGADFGMPDVEQLERGYTWVGITTQRVAHEGQPSLAEDMPATIGLCEWDPERYGSLHHPGDAFSYDIFSQGARPCAKALPPAPTCSGDSRHAYSSPPVVPSRRCVSVPTSTSAIRRTVSSTVSFSRSTGACVLRLQTCRS
jgi:hypothetical protein